MTVSGHLTCSFLLDHETFIAAIYRQVASEEGPPSDYSLLPGLFAITSPYRSKGQRNRKRKMRSKEDDIVNGEVIMVKNQFHKLREEINILFRDKFPKIMGTLSLEVEVKTLSKGIFEKTNFDFGSIQGGNNSATPLRCRINNESYLIPPVSRFLCGNVVEQVGKLKQQKYDLIVADPPWWNKYIRRLKAVNPSLSYSMMYNEDIASIPVRPLLAAGCLVAVWCTNSPSNVRAVEELIFPAWGVVPVATWYWMKVTRALEPVCAFGEGSAKQPYERIMLGAAVAEAEGADRRIPNHQMLVSVPSALHSHKPPLIEVLSPYLQASEPRCLELFARYLLPRTTSLGYEPLKWQHISLYQESTTLGDNSG